MSEELQNVFKQMMERNDDRLRDLVQQPDDDSTGPNHKESVNNLEQIHKEMIAKL